MVQSGEIDAMPNNLTTFSRRRLLAGAGVGAAAMVTGFPSIVRAQAKELVVGGAAGFAPWMNGTVAQAFEAKYKTKIVYEGTKSLVNLEKMQKNKDKQYLSVVMMDDPVMILAVKESLLEKLTPATVPNLAKIRPDAIHMDGMWANYLQPWQGIAYNTKSLPAGVAAWADMYDAKFKGRLVIPSLQNTEGLANLVVAAAIETGKPIAQAQFDIDAGFKKIKTLKPNLLTIYTQIPQALNLLEQGEAWAIPSMFSSNVIPKEKESPMKLAVPKEGIFVGPAGVCLVKGGPNKEMALALIDMLLGADMQDKLQPETFAFPSNSAAKPPLGLAADVKVHNLDWEFVAKERGEWVKRWDREMAM
jgi:putative spermidine/putrescine transport system substrate-binding protein